MDSGFPRLAVLFLIVFCAAVVTGFAQNSETIKILVQDPQGLPVIGAKVAVPDGVDGASCTTDNVGTCELAANSPATLDVVARGFATAQVEVSAGEHEAQVTMRIKSTTELTVTSRGLSLFGSGQGELLKAEEVDRVPIWLRKLDHIQPLLPGVVPKPTDDDWGEGVSADGSRDTMMNSVLDGAPNRAERRGGAAIKPPLEAVSEMKVLTSGYSAEYGHTAGAQLIMTTKSGTDNLHGDLYNYARDRFGGTLGGPLRKGRSYFFGSYERANTNFDSPVTSTVFTPSQLNASSNAITKAMLPLVPVSPTGTVTNTGEHSVDTQMIVRLDAVLSDRSKLTARAARGSGLQVLEPDVSIYPRDWPPISDRATSTVVAYNRDTINRNLSVRASYLDTLGDSISACHYDKRYSLVLAGAAATSGCPIIEITGYAPFGDAPHLFTYNSRSTTAGAILASTVGPATLKVGLEGNLLRYSSADPSQENGYLLFNGTYSGSALTDFLLGVPALALRDSKPKQRGELSQRVFAGFAQTNIRLGESLVVDVGARLEFLPSPTGRSGGLSNFSPALGAVENGAQQQLLASQGVVVDPRMGFTWAPFGSRTTIRGGIGQYSGTDALSVILDQLTAAPNPRYFVSSVPYAVPINPSAPSWTPIDTSVTRGINVRNRPMHVYQYSATVEHDFSSALHLEVAYVGTKGMRLGRLFNINMPFPSGNIDSFGNPVLTRKYPAFGDIIYDDQGASSSYNAGRIKLQHRAGRGFEVNLSYSFSKSIDDASSTGNRNWTNLPYAQDPRNLEAERAVSDFNHTHQLSGFVFVVLDRYSHAAFLRRSELSAVVNMMSGLPFSPITDYRYLYRPDVVGDPYANVPPGFLINPAAFKVHVPTASDPNPFGDAPRNSLTTPYFNTLDVAFNKGFMIKSRTELKFRVECFNLLDRRVPYIGNLMDTSTFGKRQHFLNEGRHIVAGARIGF